MIRDTPAVRREFTQEGILDHLRQLGMRITPGRRAILRVFFEATTPLSLTEIQQNAKKLGGNPDYATVFRMVSVLENLRLVAKVNLQRSCSYYELRDPKKHYDHLVCRSCSKVILIEIPCPLSKMEEDINSRYHFTALTHSLEFFGICPECTEEPQTVWGAAG